MSQFSIMKRDGWSNRKISDVKIKIIIESPISSDIEEDDLDYQQEVYHLD